MYLPIKKIQILHLEFTSLCNARCPMCARTDNNLLPMQSLSLNDIQSMLPSSFISNLGHMYSCGNYGDPVVNPECVEICKYFLDNGCPSVRLFSNGGVRTTDFWRQLGELGISVVFAIDGLEDTNHIYRVGVDWNKLMNNVAAFISAGGKARWAYLIFEHNEHQVEEARALANKMGFESFTEKASSRFRSGANPTEEKPKIHNRTGVEIKKSTVSDKFQTSAENVVKKHGSWDKYTRETKITCKTQTDRSLYIDFAGTVWPCCWMGASAYDKKSDVVEDLTSYPINMNSLRHHSIDDILSNKWFNQDLANSWKSSNTRYKVCAKNCGESFSPVHFKRD